MNDRTKVALYLAGAVVCIGCAGILVRTFMGVFPDEGPTTFAGPALTLNVEDSQRSLDRPAYEHYAYISGAVENPGVYPIDKNARVFNLLEAAGGLRTDADTSQINLAAPIRDGTHIHVKTITFQSPATGQKSRTKPSLPKNSSDSRKNAKTAGNLQYVFINTATEEEIAQLPGIGPSLAKRIIEYRQAHGSFTDAEGLLKVSGIGRAKLESMRSLLRF